MFQRSKQLLRESLAVLRSEPSLLAFPIISGIMSAIVTASFVVPLYFALGSNPDPESLTPVQYLMVFGYYLASYFVVIFFQAGLIGAAYQRLNGKDIRFADGLRIAVDSLPRIISWALISATVGIVLRALSDRGSIFVKIVVALIGAAWSVVTLFVIPIMVIEKQSAGAAMKESVALFKKTWGENAIGQLSLGLAMIGLWLLGLAPLVLAVLVQSWVAILAASVALVLYWIGLAIISSSLTGIFVAALYTYARTGTVPAAFSPDLVQGAFVAKAKL